MLFDVDRGSNLWENFGHNNHIYENFQLDFLLHTELPEQLTLDNNDSTVDLNRAIFRAASVSCSKLFNFIKTISPLKKKCPPSSNAMIL